MSEMNTVIISLDKYNELIELKSEKILLIDGYSVVFSKEIISKDEAFKKMSKALKEAMEIHNEMAIENFQLKSEIESLKKNSWWKIF